MQHAADLIPHITAGAAGDSGILTEGPRWEIVVSPGVFRVRTRDCARAERAHERAVERPRKNVDVAVTWAGDMPDLLPIRGVITAWTRQSRARLSDLDYARLYGQFDICTSCREEYDEHLHRCPRCCRPSASWRTAVAGLPAMLTLTYRATG